MIFEFSIMRRMVFFSFIASFAFKSDFILNFFRTKRNLSDLIWRREGWYFKTVWMRRKIKKRNIFLSQLGLTKKSRLIFRFLKIILQKYCWKSVTVHLFYHSQKRINHVLSVLQTPLEFRLNQPIRSAEWWIRCVTLTVTICLTIGSENVKPKELAWTLEHIRKLQFRGKHSNWNINQSLQMPT